VNLALIYVANVQDPWKMIAFHVNRICHWLIIIHAFVRLALFGLAIIVNLVIHCVEAALVI
jgi:hypothetical protein